MIFNKALVKNGSFGFAEVLALSVGAKANVPFVGKPKNFKIFARGQVPIESTEFSCHDLGDNGAGLQFIIMHLTVMQSMACP